MAAHTYTKMIHYVYTFLFFLYILKVEEEYEGNVNIHTKILQKSYQRAIK